VKRFGEIEELANLAAYMVSDYSSFLNGEVTFFVSIVTENNEWKKGSICIFFTADLRLFA